MHTNKSLEFESCSYSLSMKPFGSLEQHVRDSEFCDSARSSLPDSVFESAAFPDFLVASDDSAISVPNGDVTSEESMVWTDDQEGSSSRYDSDAMFQDFDNNNNMMECQQSDYFSPVISREQEAGPRLTLPIQIRPSAIRSRYSETDMKKMAYLRRNPHKLNEPSHSPLILRTAIAPQTENFRRFKSSSTSTLFINSTIKAPNNDEIVRCMGLTIYWNIMSFESRAEKTDVRHIFSEQYYPLDGSTGRDVVPSQDTVYRFLKSIFTAENLSAECGVMMLAYIDRLQALVGIPLIRSTWRRVCLGCIILASKVWEDQAVWNADFLKLFPLLEVRELNRLEREVLRALQFNVSLKASVYAKYYFELRSLSEKDARHFPLKPLDKNGAKKLEECSLGVEDVVKRTRKRSMSVDCRDAPSMPALLS